jgi:hypothetical protein
VQDSGHERQAIVGAVPGEIDEDVDLSSRMSFAAWGSDACVMGRQLSARGLRRSVSASMIARWSST